VREFKLKERGVEVGSLSPSSTQLGCLLEPCTCSEGSTLASTRASGTSTGPHRRTGTSFIVQLRPRR
jgi:hypothetical protein